MMKFFLGVQEVDKFFCSLVCGSFQSSLAPSASDSVSDSISASVSEMTITSWACDRTRGIPFGARKVFDLSGISRGNRKAIAFSFLVFFPEGL